jgi:hypothetical protein
MTGDFFFLLGQARLFHEPSISDCGLIRNGILIPSRPFPAQFDIFERSLEQIPLFSNSLLWMMLTC